MLRSLLGCSTAYRACLPGILEAATTNIQQTRNTFILKRRWPPGLHKKAEKPKRFRSRQYIYDLVEDTEVRKVKDIEVVLTTFVDGIGQKGDIVSLKPRYAHNMLLLPGLAVYKTEKNIQKYKKDADEPEVKKHSSPYVQRTINMIEGLILPIVMNKDHPWVIEKWHIRASLRKAGYYATDESITIPETPIRGPDLSLENKEFTVQIKINGQETAILKCRIHHWSTDPVGRLPYLPEFWKLPSDPIVA
ncbi:39S ribosomal protein L9, mitochondrial [Lutzomyia longipalpis]|uniref:39S ribosomal protein L9, mitochondrial n=1 Tax=Lutzomyia longipalpis TaxID=7200 RepID=UPI00248378EE|nr:39S ribosomal protein L9, mitochondrial [Lutzomyia longipalpis]